MSQWGEERRFLIGADVEITVLPHVKTAGFEPLNLESEIEDVLLTSVMGDRTKAEELFERVKQQYVGRPYAEWRRPGPPRPLPAPAPVSPKKPFVMKPPENFAGFYETIPCKIRQWGDTTGCEKPGCGLRWDTNDPDPPRCPRLAVARGRVALGRHYPSTPSPSPLLAGFPWRLSALLILLGLGLAYLGWIYGAIWIVVEMLGGGS